MLFPTPPTPPGIEICQHISLYAPLSCTVNQPSSGATVPVATTNTTITSSSSNNSTSNSNTNMIYIFRYQP